MRGSSDALSITIEQNAAVTASAGSATGVSTARLSLADDLAATNTSKIKVTNKGMVTANQSTANLSVSAIGVVTGAVSGGNVTGNEVNITNNGAVTAKSLADTDKTAAASATASIIKQAKAAVATALSAQYAASATAVVAEIDNIKLALTAKITIGGTVYPLTTAAQKAEAKKAWFLENNSEALALIADKKNELVLAGNAVSATGVVAADVSAGGKLEILNSGAITNNKNVADTAITAITRPKTGVVSSTGLSLTGAVTVKAGNISVSQTGSVAGITAATGIAMNSASGTGVAAVNKSVTVDSGTADVTNIGAVTSLVLISETGSVTSDSAIGKSIGIVATGNVTATVGKVEINQSGGVHGGVSAIGYFCGDDYWERQNDESDGREFDRRGL